MINSEYKHGLTQSEIDAEKHRLERRIRQLVIGVFIITIFPGFYLGTLLLPKVPIWGQLVFTAFMLVVFTYFHSRKFGRQLNDLVERYEPIGTDRIDHFKNIRERTEHLYQQLGGSIPELANQKDYIDGILALDRMPTQHEFKGIMERDGLIELLIKEHEPLKQSQDKRYTS